MKIALLTQHPAALPVLARWYYDAWGREAGISLDDELAKLTKALHTTLPMVLVALDDGEVIGCVQVKEREMAQFPELAHWLGGVYVASHCRGKGVARLLINEAVTLAARMGIGTMHLQTEEPSGGLYRQLGWVPLFPALNHGINVLVMARALEQPESNEAEAA